MTAKDGTDSFTGSGTLSGEMTSDADAARYVVAGAKPWSREVFDDVICHYPGSWTYVDDPGRLAETVQMIRPRYAFFLHWSWKVQPDVLGAAECVNFHMTDVPYGRGGSPLQNLIIRGHKETKVTALGMVDEMDAGPVYAQRVLALHGTAEEVYGRAMRTAAEMIGGIAATEPQPVAQTGEVVTFKRRKPGESEMPRLDDLEAVYDFIRMLDADGYPKAFIDHEGFRYTFSRAALYDGRVVADVQVTPIEGAAS
jgi:methionyl-tRNA formyltransferase